MPHVVLTGELEIGAVFRKMEKIFHKDENGILKTGDRYLESEGKSIIIEATAIENGPPRSFFILVSKRDDGMVVRLHPALDVEKTDGVKRALALVAKQVMAAFPGASIGKTNLQEFL
jgi:hypothetical protein